eukprot:1637847-Ditylum_brightwellii.AAC.1
METTMMVFVILLSVNRLDIRPNGAEGERYQVAALSDGNDANWECCTALQMCSWAVTSHGT